MKVPAAYALVLGGSGQTRKDHSRMPYWGVPLWIDEDEIDYDDKQKFFWCTKGRSENDCLHSRRVGVVTGEWVPPILAQDGRKVVWEGEFYFFNGNNQPKLCHQVYSQHNNIYCVMWQYGTGGTKYIDLRIIHYHANRRFPPNPARYLEGYSIEYKVEFRWRDDQWNTYETYSANTRNHQWTSTSFLRDSLLSLLIDVPFYINGKFNYKLFDIFSERMDLFKSSLSDWVSEVQASGISIPYTSYYLYYGAYPEPVGDHFLFHEIERIRDHLDPMLYSGDFTNYWWNVLIQNAYLDCLESMPRLNQNSISNILEIVSFIKSLVLDGRIEMPKSLADAWLSYRYQYNTTKSDVKDAIDFVHRYVDLGGLERSISSRGRSSIDYLDTHVNCRCQAKLSPKELDTLSKIWSTLYTYGLAPDFYVVWDMIPYSFVVDWFLPVGRLAEVLDAQSFYPTHYNITDIIMSVSYDVWDTDGNLFRQYARWVQGTPIELNGFYFLEPDKTSGKIIGYRALDTLSLTIG